MIPNEVREEHLAICEKCKMRKQIAKIADMHFDWLDCPYDCENDYEHWKGEPMRLIDKDALMQSLGITDMDCDKCAWGDREWRNCKRGGDFEDACCAIENAPTIEECRPGKCGYQRMENGYATDCGHVVKHIGREWKHCPFCGSTIANMRRDWI